jgi:hypothetical protein
VTGHTVPAQATQTIQAPTQPKERELDDMRKELQDIKRQLASRKLNEMYRNRMDPPKRKCQCLPNTCADDRYTLLLLSPLLLSSLVEFSS